MPFRRSGYGLIVESHEGRPTKIEGNPAHPSTLGASASIIQGSVLGLYDPDRSQSVLFQGTQKSWGDFVTAWGPLAAAHAADGGAGLAVLSESFSSPTMARLAAELKARYPQSHWATYDAVSDENRLAGLRQATGRDLDLLLPLRPGLGDPRPRRRPAPDRSGDDPALAGLRRRTARGAVERQHESPLRRGRGLLADRCDGGSSAPVVEPADRPVPGGAGGAGRGFRGPGRGAGRRERPGCRSPLDRGGGQRPPGQPRQEPDRRGRAPAARGPRRGVRAELVSRQHRDDGELLRAEGRGAAERRRAGLPRVLDERGRDQDARRARRQSRVRCAGRPRLRLGDGARSPRPSRSGTGSTRRPSRRPGTSRSRTTSSRGETRARSAAP